MGLRATVGVSEGGDKEDAKAKHEKAPHSYFVA
jgi:hypothetical protein